jgi:hypothetical protein
MTHSSSLKAAFVAAAVASIYASGANARKEHSNPQNTQDNYSGYESPRGYYANPADFIRSVEGTPCGIECTQQHEKTWGHQQR